MKKLAIAFVALNALDIALTLHFVGSGTSFELNPFMKMILSGSLIQVIAFKTVVPVLFMVMIALLPKLFKRYTHWNFRCLWVAQVVVIAELIICGFNATAILL